MADVKDYLVGSCAIFNGFLERFGAGAASAATVLLFGESGTGKSLCAQALHACSARSDGPLVTVSLAALSPTLLESELFGHEEGAFTGAHRSRRGRFRMADGGTLVLEDVGSLPLELQGKLLRVLQERQVEPLGAESPLAVDVRVVATAQTDLTREVEAGTFRKDLYWRLAVVPLEVPPLRDRLEDLPLLVAALSGRLHGKHGLPPRALSDAAMQRLASYPWPGNVLELENALERALVLSATDDGAAIGPEAFDFLDRGSSAVADELCERALAHGLTLKEIETALLQRAVSEAHGNLTAAARKIGLTRRALDYRLARARRPDDGGDGGDGGGEDEP
jgi:transcriptional regulator with GAF, ATPase, and Fis domain